MDGRSTPLFAVPGRARGLGRVTVAPGSVLVCYTDGLIERPRRSLYEGMTTLARAGLTLRDLPLSEFTTGLLDVMTAGQALADDVALLCVTLSGADSRGTVGISRSLPRRSSAAAVSRGRALPRSRRSTGL
jgi:hypothetical protein